MLELGQYNLKQVGSTNIDSKNVVLAIWVQSTSFEEDDRPI